MVCFPSEGLDQIGNSIFFPLRATKGQHVLFVTKNIRFGSVKLGEVAVFITFWREPAVQLWKIFLIHSHLPQFLARHPLPPLRRFALPYLVGVIRKPGTFHGDVVALEALRRVRQGIPLASGRHGLQPFPARSQSRLSFGDTLGFPVLRAGFDGGAGRLRIDLLSHIRPRFPGDCSHFLRHRLSCVRDEFHTVSGRVACTVRKFREGIALSVHGSAPLSPASTDAAVASIKSHNHSALRPQSIS